MSVPAPYRPPADVILRVLLRSVPLANRIAPGSSTTRQVVTSGLRGVPERGSSAAKGLVLMAIGNESFETPTWTAWTAFARGFLIRMLYGSPGVLFVVLIRPDFLGENLHLLVAAIAAYLLVCLAGGAADATVGRTTSRLSLPMGRALTISSLVLLVMSLVLLWQGR
jgi:hypothetical protein